jgi:hypothetical protein
MKGFTDSGFFRKGLPVVGLMLLGILVFGAVSLVHAKTPTSSSLAETELEWRHIVGIILPGNACPDAEFVPPAQGNNKILSAEQRNPELSLLPNSATLQFSQPRETPHGSPTQVPTYLPVLRPLGSSTTNVRAYPGSPQAATNICP